MPSYQYRDPHYKDTRDCLIFKWKSPYLKRRSSYWNSGLVEQSCVTSVGIFNTLPGATHLSWLDIDIVTLKIFNFWYVWLFTKAYFWNINTPVNYPRSKWTPMITSVFLMALVRRATWKPTRTDNVLYWTQLAWSKLSLYSTYVECHGNKNTIRFRWSTLYAIIW